MMLSHADVAEQAEKIELNSVAIEKTIGSMVFL
jgi:hypothetical protein